MKKAIKAKIKPPVSRKGNEKPPSKVPENKGTFIRTKSEYVHFIARFMSDVEVRYYLCGINFQKHPDGGLLVTATNGHILGTFYDPDGVIQGCDDVTIPISKRMITLSNPNKKRVIPLDFYHADDVAYLAPTGLDKEGAQKIGGFTEGVEHAKFIDGKFPDWPRVLPTNLCPQEKSSFNPDFMKLFAFGEKPQVTAYFSKGEHEQILVRNHYANFIGVIMPMVDKRTEVFPDFIVTLKAAADKRAKAALAKKQKEDMEALKKKQDAEKKALVKQQRKDKAKTKKSAKKSKKARL